MIGPISFRDERIEKKGENFETSINLIFRDGKDKKTLVGKGTMPVRRFGENIEMDEFMKYYCHSWQNREMKEKAKQAAISAFFKEVYGYTDTSDIEVDEFDRPRIDKTRRSCLDCLTIDLTTET